MVQTLLNLCMDNKALTRRKYLYEKLPRNLYINYVYYIACKNFDEWKKKITLVNIELNIKDMDIEQDMYFDELTYHIYVKKKNVIFNNGHELNFDHNDDDEEYDFNEDEYVLYHEYHDNPDIYDAYLEIAKIKNLISDFENEYIDEEYNQYNDF